MIRKTQILTWAVILLAILNAVTIGTILYHNYQENRKKDEIVINNNYGGNMINGRFLRQSLGFDGEQMSAFRDVNQVFRPAVLNLTISIDSLKTKMFTELQQAVQDTTVLNEMANQIGVLHGQLKYETYKFFISLKKVCKEDQVKELEKAFQPLFKSEEITTPPFQHRNRGLNKKQ